MLTGICKDVESVKKDCSKKFGSEEKGRQIKGGSIF